jgi:predicted CxxxxCH...CXXCH cytochrome family protein
MNPLHPLAIGAVLVCAGCLSRRAEEQDRRPSECTACHGSRDRDAGEVARAAPPGDLEGRSEVSAPGVGAHQIHLTASPTHAAVACESCHVVPASVTDPGHLDTPPPADVVFGAAARAGGHDSPNYDPTRRTCSNVYCHGEASPQWTAPLTSDQACGTCHTLPPPPPHPDFDRCSVCHSAVVGEDNRTIISPALHVNGRADYEVPSTCYACHGSAESNAPPPALNGFFDVPYRGVGAHQTHLTRERYMTKIDCSTCHVVPVDVLWPGHIDTPRPAEVVFSIRATADAGPAPSWDGTACSNTYCHDPGNGQWGGANPTPIWAEFNQEYCGTCHGLPPPDPHPPRPEGGLSVCSDCHSNMTPNDEFIDVSKHMNGVIDF